jgi:hypothetical protein
MAVKISDYMSSMEPSFSVRESVCMCVCMHECMYGCEDLWLYEQHGTKFIRECMYVCMSVCVSPCYS